MSHVETPSEHVPDEDWTPSGFTRLTRRGPSPQTQVGCIFLITTPLLVVGVGIISLYLYNPAGKGSMWVMPLVGGVFALVGLLGLIAGVRGLRGSSIPDTELFIEKGARPALGASIHLRLRQPGPVRIESLKVTAVCERTYQRRVRSTDMTTIENHQFIQDLTVLEIRHERIGKHETLEREVEFTVPADAPPTGPAQPDGTIRWTLEVRGEAGFMRSTFHPFEITVDAADSL